MSFLKKLWVGAFISHRLPSGGGLAVPGDSSGFPNPAPGLTPELGGVFLPLELNYLAVFAPNALPGGGGRLNPYPYIVVLCISQALNVYIL